MYDIRAALIIRGSYPNLPSCFRLSQTSLPVGRALCCSIACSGSWRNKWFPQGGLWGMGCANIAIALRLANLSVPSSAVSKRRTLPNETSRGWDYDTVVNNRHEHVPQRENDKVLTTNALLRHQGV